MVSPGALPDPLEPSPGVASGLLALRDYTVDALVQQTAASTVYRAHRASDGARVIVKLAAGEHPTAAAQARLRHEHNVLRSLADVPQVVRAHGLEKCANGVALILEPCGQSSVLTATREGTLGLPQRLEFAVQMAAIVESVHEKNLIHKDLHPGHFMIGGDGRLTLIDFGVATTLSLETPSSTGALEGTLAYIAPEQTGRMNRSVDRRSDLYSLGATLYELFTGERPFAAEDPLELVHCHIARVPRPPHEVRRDVPPILSAIIVKLLSKSAEDRYQEAAGLRFDLETCLATLDAAGRIPEFALGRADVSRELRIPQKLYGRGEQLATLQAAFRRARGGSAEVLVVRGDSGTGKSALVHEFNKGLARHGMLVSGRFDQLNRNVPYAPIVSGCRHLVRALLAQPEEGRAPWRVKLADALGPNARLVVGLVPELEGLIGPQPAVPELGPAESQHRFEVSFQWFIEVFASREHPLVFFLDDLQWADATSLRLLYLLATSSSVGHALIIGAYRDREFDALGPLGIALASLRKAGVALTEIELRGLGVGDVAELLADTLHAPVDALAGLADLTLRKTLGNPFFVGQFLKSLRRQGLLAFDPVPRSWIWDPAGIDRATVTDNVVDFLVAKLHELPAEACRLLELAACIGYEFDRETLGVISAQRQGEVVTNLRDALALGLVVPLDGNYRYAAEEGDVAEERTFTASYRFSHDRVQQTAYTLLDAEGRQAVHLQIARRLLDGRGGEVTDDELFRVVDHLNIGAPRMTEPAERAQLARLNLRAGLRARDAAAYGAAAKLLANCLAALGAEEQAWRDDYDIAYRAHLARAESEFLSANNDEAFRQIDVLERRAWSLLERVAVASLQTVMLTMLNRLEEAMACGVSALRKLGVSVPDRAGMGAAVAAEVGAVAERLRGQDIGGLVELPAMTDPEKLAMVDLVCRLIPATFQSDQALLALLLAKATSLMLEHGNAPASPHLYQNFSLVFGAATGDVRTAFALSQAGVTLNERLQSTAAAATHFTYAAFIVHWWRPLSLSFEHLDRGMKAALESGDLPHVGYCATHDLYYHYYGGENLAQLDVRRRAAEALLARNEDAIGLLTVALFGQAMANLRGDARHPESLDTADLSEAELLQRIGPNQATRAWYLLVKLHITYLAGNYVAALAYAEESESLAEYTSGSLIDVERVFYRAMASGQLLRTTHGEARTALLASLDRDEQTLASWTENAPQNNAHRHALVAAERAAAVGSFDRALTLYERAIEAARDNDFAHHEAMANELCGLFHLRRGRATLGRYHLTEAHQGFLRWGARGVARSLVARHPAVGQGSGVRSSFGGATDVGNAPRVTVGETGRTGVGSAGSLDIESMIKATRLISGEVRLDRLFAALMATIIENAGAQRGCLILTTESNDKLSVEAAARLDGGPRDFGRSTPIDEFAELCPTIVREVARSREPMVVDDAGQDPRYGDDRYVLQNGVKSVLCVPVLHQAKLLAILYTENNEASHAFTSERVRLLEVIAGQAAISITNARLYDQLEEKVAERTRELSERNREVAVMLNSMQQGVFTIDETLAIQPRYSDHLERIVDQRGVTGRDCIEVLFGGTNVGQDRLAAMRSALQFSFGMPLFIAEVNWIHLIKSFDRPRDGGEVQYLEVDWNPIVDESAELRKILVTVRDATAVKTLQATMAKSARELDVVGQILDAGPVAFLQLVESAHAALRQNRDILRRGPAAIREQLAQLFRALHSLKGNARMLGLSHLVEVVHAAEDAYTDLREQPDRIPDPPALLARLDEVLDALGEYENVFRRKLGDLERVPDARRKQALDAIAIAVGEMAAGTLAPGDAIATLQGALKRAAAVPLREIVGDGARMLPSLARELGKAAPRVDCADAGAVLSAPWAQVVRDVLVHAFRNALDHGIESEPDRRAKGKPDAGTIAVHCALRRQSVHVRVFDDGQGLALHRLRERFGAESRSDEELAELVFVSGVSTAERLSTVSGRGVGLDAIRALLRDHGGDARILLRGEPGETRRPFELVLELPEDAVLADPGSSLRSNSA